MASILLEPVPNEEARRFIADKPVVSRRVFDRLVPEVQGRVFTITGVRSADTMQRVRDRIADLPMGADWDEVKKDIVKQVLPDFVDPDATPEERDKAIASSNRRAELLMRTHGFQAYQSAAWHAHEEMTAVFPYRRYITVGDERVRDSHRALHGVILPVDDPFWDDHYPPWDYGCRCQAVPVSRAAYEKELARDGERDADAKRVPGEAQRNDMRTSGRLIRDGQVYDVKPPREKTGRGYKWHPRDLRTPVEELKERYSPEVWQAFDSAARNTTIPAGKTTLSQWLGLSGEDGSAAAGAGPVHHPDDLLRQRGYSAEVAAKVLNEQPGYEESVVMRRWARDGKGQRAIAWGQSAADRHQREVFSRIVDGIEPYRSEAPAFRGFKSRIQPGTGRDMLRDILSNEVYENPSPGMSASKSFDVAQRTDYLGRNGFLVEIRKHRSARDFEPIAKALHPQHKNEAEVVFPYGRFKLLEVSEVEIVRGPQRWSVPLLIMEEI